MNLSILLRHSGFSSKIQFRVHRLNRHSFSSIQSFFKSYQFYDVSSFEVLIAITSVYHSLKLIQQCFKIQQQSTLSQLLASNTSYFKVSRGRSQFDIGDIEGQLFETSCISSQIKILSCRRHLIAVDCESCLVLSQSFCVNANAHIAIALRT